MIARNSTYSCIQYLSQKKSPKLGKLTYLGEYNGLQSSCLISYKKP